VNLAWQCTLILSMMCLCRVLSHRCYNNVQERIHMHFGNDSQEIKSWVDNDNHAYRLGDVVLHAGKYFDDLKSCILALHNGTLAAKYLQQPEYIANPTIARNHIQNMELFNKVLMQHCPPPTVTGENKDKSGDHEVMVMVHLRLGDGVYGKQNVAQLRTPYPLRCYAQALSLFRSPPYRIGLIFNNTASSIFASSPPPSSGSNTNNDGFKYTSNNQRHHEKNNNSDHISQYLHQLQVMFPSAYAHDPHASPDEHFCAMVNAPVFVTGKGTARRSV
jgi:hypothetical protein